MKVHWTETAQEHLDAIHAHVAQNSPASPSASSIASHVARSKSRFFPSRIVYHIKPNQIDVLAVIHGAQDVLRG